MSLREVDIGRLENFKRDLESLKLRFPIAELAERMKVNKGNISAYLRGKKPVSENFLQRFYEEFFSVSPIGVQGLSPGLGNVGESNLSFEVDRNKLLEINKLMKEMEEELQRIEKYIQEFRSAINEMNVKVRVTISRLEGEDHHAAKRKTKKSIKKAARTGKKSG